MPQTAYRELDPCVKALILHFLCDERIVAADMAYGAKANKVFKTFEASVARGGRGGRGAVAEAARRRCRPTPFGWMRWARMPRVPTPPPVAGSAAGSAAIQPAHRPAVLLLLGAAAVPMHSGEGGCPEAHVRGQGREEEGQEQEKEGRVRPPPRPLGLAPPRPLSALRGRPSPFDPDATVPGYGDWETVCRMPSDWEELGEALKCKGRTSAQAKLRALVVNEYAPVIAAEWVSVERLGGAGARGA